jgi:hypothetical protein
MAIVTWFVAVVTTLPCASSTLTTTAGVIELPAAALEGCTVKASFAGGPMVTVFELPHPPTKNRESKTEVARILQITLAADRDRLDIAVLPF